MGVDFTELNEEVIYGKNTNEQLFRLFNVEVMPMRRAFQQHHHISFEIVLFKEGRGKYAVLGKEYEIEPGDVFLFSGNEIHCITEIYDGQNMRLMNLHIKPRFIWSAGNDQLDAGYLKIFYARNRFFQNRLPRNHPATEQIRRLILESEEECAQKQPGYELMVKAKLLQLLTLSARSYGWVLQEDDSLELYRQNFRKIETALQFIDENLCDELTLENIADSVQMGRTYFSTVFKRLNGISPWDYIIARRIERAIPYIEKAEKTVLEIACLCGFNNTANFNRAFRRITGKTPTEYRKSGKESMQL